MTKNTVPNNILNDIENHFGNHSISSMGSDLYCVGVFGDYGSYEIMIPANGHCTIKMDKTTKSGRYDNISWYYYSPEWFERCEETQTLNESKTNMNMKKNTIKLTESQLKKVIAESVNKVLNEIYFNDGYYSMPGEGMELEQCDEILDRACGYCKMEKMPIKKEILKTST